MSKPLLADRRFWPFFWTQFLGAFNDNFFKTAVVMLVTYGGLDVLGLEKEQVVPLAGGIFIIPYFFFSGTSGLLSDKLEKSSLIRQVKLAEIVVMALAGLGFWLHGGVFAIGPLSAGVVLLITLFLMGLQSTVFSPAKYAAIPEVVDADKLVGANALVSLGTFLAILAGTILGGLVGGSTALEAGTRAHLLAGGVLGFAALGYVTSRFIHKLPASNPDLKLTLNPVTPTVEMVRITASRRPLLLSVLGISWFWFFGAAFMSMFPTYTEGVLYGNPAVATLMLAAFSVGIGMGSMLCERLSGGQLELGLVPFGTLGMSLFTLDLFFVGAPWGAPAGLVEGNPDTLYTMAEFLSRPDGIRIAFDLVMIALSGGLYIVPLQTLIQERSEPDERSRVIAGNNILNAIFMVASAGFLIGMKAAGLRDPQIFGILAIGNLVVSGYIYTVIPEFTLRFSAWSLSRLMYRLQVSGIDRIPAEGPVVLVCNHVSYVDWLVIGGASRRPARFVMYYKFMKLPLMRIVARGAHLIPIAGRKENPELLQKAMDQIAAELEAGEVVCIFPEGALTKDGDIAQFRKGIEKILERTPAPVVPMALNGLWGSWFSNRGGKAMSKPPRRFLSRIQLTVDEPIEPEGVTADSLEAHVRGIWEKGAP